MKKKFVALLISAAMVSGSLALPVYAAEEETAIEFADDEEDIVDVEEEAEEQEDTDMLEIPARLLAEILTGEAPIQPYQRM